MKLAIDKDINPEQLEAEILKKFPDTTGIEFNENNSEISLSTTAGKEGIKRVISDHIPLIIEEGEPIILDENEVILEESEVSMESSTPTKTTTTNPEKNLNIKDSCTNLGETLETFIKGALSNNETFATTIETQITEKVTKIVTPIRNTQKKLLEENATLSKENQRLSQELETLSKKVAQCESKINSAKITFGG